MVLLKWSRERAELGAKQNELHSIMNNLEVFTENLSSANSRIRDTEFAEETAKNTKLNILNNAGISALLKWWFIKVDKYLKVDWLKIYLKLFKC